jgi:hypothetical protein
VWRRLLITVALSLLVPATSWAQVSELAAWVMDDAYPTAVLDQDIDLVVPAGSDRLLVVFLSAEANPSTFSLDSVTYGTQELTVGRTTIAASGTYGNLLWFGYLDENGLSSQTSPQALRVNWANAPTGIAGDLPQIHYAIYQGVNQDDPIADSSHATFSGVGPLAVTSEMSSRDGDYWIGFNVLGNPGTTNGASLTCPTSWTEHNEASAGVVVNGHASETCSLATTADVTSTPSFDSTGTDGGAGERRGVMAVVLRDDVPPDPGISTVRLLGVWDLDADGDVDFGYLNNTATLTPEPGVGGHRLVTVLISAERLGIACTEPCSTNDPMHVSSVSLGNQALTEVWDFTTGNTASYHNLNWFGYLDEAGIIARDDDELVVVFGEPQPSNPFGGPRIHMATYNNVNQATPIRVVSTVEQAFTNNTGTSTANTLALPTSLDIGARDKVLAFAVLGEPGAIQPISGYTEHIDQAGGTNDHTAAVLSRDSFSLATEGLTFVATITNRMAVGAAVLALRDTPVITRRVMTVH